VSFGADGKLERANQHLQALKEYIERWQSSHPYAISEEVDPNTGDDIVRFERIDPPPTDILFLIGDCLYNLRSALDHLIHSLAVKNCGSLSEEQSVETAFPIYKTQSGFLKRGKGRIKHLAPKAQAIIERLQPYQAGDAATLQWLWILEKLENIDKHRSLLLTITLNPAEVIIEIPPRSKVSFQVSSFASIRNALEVPTRVLEAETQYIRYRCVRDDDGARVKVNFNPVLYIVFHSSPAEGLEVVSTLETIYKFIATEVLPRLRPFL
jgi:hypothetical protein